MFGLLKKFIPPNWAPAPLARHRLQAAAASKTICSRFIRLSFGWIELGGKATGQWPQEL
jgi:hypothetical protein